jgi:hypothetical protein
MSTSTDPSATSDATAVDATESQAPAPAPLQDDLDFSDVQLNERQPEACSMEEGCERCQ